MAESSFEFEDLDTGDIAFCGVRCLENGVGIALSLRHNGDLYVYMSRKNAQRLAALLLEAASESEGPLSAEGSTS